MASPDLPIAMQYAWGVRRGEIVACRYVKLAVERHFRDLENGHERGLWFDPEAADRVIRYISKLRMFKGRKWAGKPFVLSPWQQFFLWVLFGWKREDGNRRFGTAYLEVPRKNGKTTLAAGIGLYLLHADGEPAAEVYAVATKRDQAKICHGAATEMVKQTPGLKRRITAFRNNLHIQSNASKFEPLGRDSNTADGLDISGAICDELHAWKDRLMWDLIETGTPAREQPLVVSITTAGFDRKSICYEQRELTIKQLEQSDADDSHFGIIYTLDKKPGDHTDASTAYDWENEEEWYKANPNMGVSLKIEDLRKKVEQAKVMSTKLNSVLRLRFNIWTEAFDRWLSPDKWAACGEHQVDIEALRGRRCYGALDLASTTDLAADALVFPPLGEESPEDPYIILLRLFCPEDNLHERSKKDRVPYEAWLRAGLLIATPGASIDYQFIRKQVNDDAELFDLQEIAFDRWGAAKLRQELEDDGHTMIEFGQGFKSMSPPTKELERLVLAGHLAHGNNVALAWMAANVVVRLDPAGNVKPDKEKSIEKIDGIVATIMALDRATRHQDSTSVYESRGVVVV